MSNPVSHIVPEAFFIQNTKELLQNITNIVQEVPKIAFTFWEGDQFSFLHYITIHSFAKYNPDYKVIIYSSTNLSDININWDTHEHSVNIEYNLDDIHRLKELPNVEFKIVDFDKEFNTSKPISSIYKSDILRIIKLYEHGGMWIDFDILFLKKLPESILKLPQNNIGIFEYGNVLPIGFIVSNKGNILLQHLLNLARSILENAEYENYQKFGTFIWTPLKNIPEFKQHITIYPTHYIYPYLWNEGEEMYYSNIDKIKEDTYGIHWYNGAVVTKKYINELNLATLDPTTSIFNRELHRVIQETNVTYTKVSVVMTSYNRKPQLLQTLKTILKSKYAKFTEIIIVDDGSDDIHRFDKLMYLTTEEAQLFRQLNIKVIYIEKFQKMWKNPCIAYNIGLKHAIGDIVIIQNSEVCHVGDCIEYVVKHLKHNDWLTLNCYGLGNTDHNDTLHALFSQSLNMTDFCSNAYNYVNTLIKSPTNIYNENLNIASHQGWLNHFVEHFTAYHYFGAIYRTDLIMKMDGGFCNKYAYGICWDDNDFIKYLIYNKFNFKINSFTDTNPFVIHQYHPSLSNIPKYSKEYYHSINKEVFRKRMNKINANMNVNIHDGFEMPNPILIRNI